MKKTPVRLVLVLLALAAIGGAGSYVFTLEQRAAALRDADRAFAEDTLRLQGTLADLRAAQAGYLATGQDTAVWVEKVQQLRLQADAQLKKLAATVPPGAASEMGTVTEALASFGRFDGRVLEVLRDEQPLTASGLIFGDAAQLLAASSRALSAVRGSAASQAGTALAELRRQELYALGGAAGVAFVVLLLLLPAPGRAPKGETETERLDEGQAFTPDVAASESSAAAAAAGEEARGGFDFDLELPPRRKIDAPPQEQAFSSAFRSKKVEQEVGAAVPSPDEQGLSPSGQVDLGAAARLCTDLARVHDTSELQGLLGRAATLLDATGIVVWMGGAEGDVLWPAFSHGYSPQALTRMQALPRDGATPVSVAFRKGLIEVVPRGEGNNGAIVTPILTAGGCVGVMAVEVHETSDAAQAMASILAAQLATLVAGEAG